MSSKKIRVRSPHFTGDICDVHPYTMNLYARTLSDFACEKLQICAYSNSDLVIPKTGTGLLLGNISQKL